MKVLKFVPLFLLLMLTFVSGCSNNTGAGTSSTSDVQFAQTAFTTLAAGDSSVENMIDWSHLRGMNMDVGAQYNALPSDTQKAGFRQGFISSFSSSFKRTGATAESLTNWRLQGNDTVMASASNGASLALTLSKADGTPKICDIEMNK